MRIDLIPLDGGALIEVLMDPGRPVIVGRAPDVDVRLADLSVGRMAVRLTAQDGSVWIEDLGSGGGSAVDGVDRYNGVLRDGALLRVGGLVTSVRLREP